MKNKERSQSTKMLLSKLCDNFSVNNLYIHLHCGEFYNAILRCCAHCQVLEQVFGGLNEVMAKLNIIEWEF